MARSDPRPRTKVTKAELMPGWWNGLGGRWQTWYLELACGHAVTRRRRVDAPPPAWVVCCDDAPTVSR